MSIIDPGKRPAEEELESERQKRVRVIKDSLLLSKGCFDPTRLIEDGLLPSEGLDPAEIRLRLISHAQDLLRSEGLDPAIAVDQDWNQLLLAQDAAGGVPESIPTGAVGVGVGEETSFDDEDFDFDGGKPLSQKYLFRDGILLKRKKTKTKKGLENTSNVVEPDVDAAQDAAVGVPESIPTEAVVVGVEEETSSDDEDFSFEGGEPLSREYFFRDGIFVKRKMTQQGLENTSNIVEPGDYEYEVVS